MFLEHSLAERGKRTRDGTPSWAAFEIGLCVSRQNGKGSILEARELAGLFLFDEKLIIHSAHQFDTSLEAFNRIKMLIDGKDEFTRHVKRFMHSHGEEGIEMMDGRRLRFRTRTKGGGRGFTCDCLLFDEAMILNSMQISALMPTLSAVANPQVYYTGSAGDEDSEHFGRVRHRAMEAVEGRAEEERLCYMEWSIDGCSSLCPEDCTDHDPVDTEASYAKSNPGLGIRITTEHIESERRSMDEAEFAKERLGIGRWPVYGEAWRIIGEDAWKSRSREPGTTDPQAPLVFAIDVTPDRSYSCITVCGANGEVAHDGTPLVQVEVVFDGARYDHRSGMAWVIPRIKQLVKDWSPAAIVIDKGSQAGAMFDDLELLVEKNRRTLLLTPTTREYAQACGTFYGSVIPRKGNEAYLIHLDQPMLTSAVAGAEKRDLSDVWAWDKRNASTDISPLVSGTLALWGHHKVATLKRSSAPWAIIA